jgi:hypothetical protein
MMVIVEQLVECELTVGTEVLEEKLPHCPPQIPHDLTWARTRAAAVGISENIQQNIILPALLRFFSSAQVNQGKLGRAVAQVVSRLLLAAAARIRSQARPCGICGRQSGFSPNTSDSLVDPHSTACS